MKASANPSTNVSTKKRALLPLVLLLIISVVPIAGAMLSYFGGLAVPEAKVNNGRLVLDQPPLQRWQLQTLSGQQWQGQGRWQLLLLVPECQHQCQQWQHLLGQIKTSLGRDRDRVQPQLVLQQRQPIGVAEEQDVAIEGIARGTQEALGTGTKIPEHVLTSDYARELDSGIWLADPLGNMVLHYRLDQSPQELMKDLKRLLKVSKVG
ncbi:MAG: hypothetical protein V7707_16105 [Motiliproteus sp.]